VRDDVITHGEVGGRSCVEERLDLLPELVAHGFEDGVVRGAVVDHERMRPAILVLQLLNVRPWRRGTLAAPELEERHTTRESREMLGETKIIN